MPVNKNPFQRYQRINEILNRRGSAIGAVKMTELMADLGVSERQVNEDIRIMREEMNAPIEYDRRLRGWRYASEFDFIDSHLPISKKDILQIRLAIEMLGKGGQIKHIKDLPGVLDKIRKAAKRWMSDKAPEKAIYFDPLPDYDGARHLDFFLDAIDQQRRTIFDYKGFQATAPKKVEFDPYFLRHYDRRWYVGGQSLDPDEQQFIRVFPLERIVGTPEHAGFYHNKPPQYNAETYWKNIYGITVPPTEKVESVVLRFSAVQGQYFLKTPFYEPFEIVEETPEYLTVALQLIPNIDLKQKLASLGPVVQVLAPEKLVKELKDWLRKALQQY